MNTTDQKPTTPRRRIPSWVIFLLLAAIPSGYFYLTGRFARTALQREVDELVLKTEALADSLDGVRTHLRLGAAQASIRKGDFESAQPLISDFFDRVDRRTREEGLEPGETEARMEVLALRDRTISALSRRAPEAGRLLEELSTLHLALADPELNARPLKPASGLGAQDSLRVSPTALPRRYPPRDTLPR
jgi:hypothetical protein